MEVDQQQQFDHNLYGILSIDCLLLFKHKIDYIMYYYNIYTILILICADCEGVNIVAWQQLPSWKLTNNNVWPKLLLTITIE